MSEVHIVDACLRVVSNRCRNLRKTIDRAKSLQQVAENGTELNEEQLESIRSVPRKEALLAELQEILRKQTLIVNSSSPPETSADLGSKSASVPSQSQDASDISKVMETTINDDDGLPQTMHPEGNTNSESADTQPKPMITNEASNVEDLNGTVHSAQNELIKSAHMSTDSKGFSLSNHDSKNNGAINTAQQTEPRSSAIPTQTSQTTPTVLGLNTETDTTGIGTTGSFSSAPRPPNQPYLSTSLQNALSDPCSEKVALLVQEIESRYAIQLQDAKDCCARGILNFFHVADFLNQSGSREALLCYFDTAEGQQKPRRVSGLDMDLIVYFNVMLTTPNGSVPHDDAVDVSTAHCLEFLKRSTSEAFKGTSYATLVDIVNAISTCPILTERGKSQAISGSKLTPSHMEKNMSGANGRVSSAMGPSVSAA